MSRRTKSTSDIKSGTQALLDGYSALRARGVDDESWRRVSNDPAFADRIAAVFRKEQPANTPSLDWLIDNAKSWGVLTYANDNITSNNFKESGVSGQLELVDVGLSGYFSTDKALAALDRLGYRPATMYEGVKYANGDWDRKTNVALLGSIRRDSYGYDCVGYLWSDGAGRDRRLVGVADDWNSSCRFLAVRNCFYGFSWLA